MSPIKHSPTNPRGALAADVRNGIPCSVREARAWLDHSGHTLGRYPLELITWLVDRVEHLEHERARLARLLEIDL